MPALDNPASNKHLYASCVMHGHELRACSAIAEVSLSIFATTALSSLCRTNVWAVWALHSVSTIGEVTQQHGAALN
jgi:hypothetical protein